MEAYLREGERLDDLQLGGLHIIQKPGEFLFGTDSVLLAHWVKSCKRVLDLGTGSGVLPLLLYGHHRPEYICGIEIQPSAANMAARSVAMNGLDNIEIINGDYRNHCQIPHKGSYDTVVANPPYHKASGDNNAGSNTAKATARTERNATLADVAGAASAALKQGGKLYMVHRPERLVDIILTLVEHRLQPKAIRAVQPADKKPPTMLLIRAVKDGKSGLDLLPPLIIHGADGSYTDEVQEIYKPR